MKVTTSTSSDKRSKSQLKSALKRNSLSQNDLKKYFHPKSQSVSFNFDQPAMIGGKESFMDTISKKLGFTNRKKSDNYDDNDDVF